MTIEELRKQKVELTKDISELFNQFENSTGIMIDRIDINRTGLTNHVDVSGGAQAMRIVTVQDHISKIHIVLRGI